MSLSTQQFGRFRGISRLVWQRPPAHRVLHGRAEPGALRENSLHRRFDSYICATPLDPELRRETYSAVAAKLARFSSTD